MVVSVFGDGMCFAQIGTIEVIDSLKFIKKPDSDFLAAFRSIAALCMLRFYYGKKSMRAVVK
jgi:hypothetical protein